MHENENQMNKNCEDCRKFISYQSTVGSVVVEYWETDLRIKECIEYDCCYWKLQQHTNYFVKNDDA